jgi:hypothetical protein
MKITHVAIAISLILILTSCWGAAARYMHKIQSMGYNTDRDTIDIKPYEYVIIIKGYYPIHEELQPDRKLDLKIGIKGYENSDSVPFNTLLQGFDLTLNDSSIKKIIKGQAIIQFGGWADYTSIDSSYYNGFKASFGFFKKHLEKYRPRNSHKDFPVLFFWNTSVMKNDTAYAIPSRKYAIKFD